MGDGLAEGSEARVRRTARRRERRREELMEAARQLLVDGGLEALTIAAVARQADVSKPSVYYYFSSKAELLAGLMIDELDREIDQLLSVAEGASSGVEALAGVLRARVLFYRDDLASYRLLYLLPQFQDDPLAEAPERREELGELRDALNWVLRLRLGEDQKQGRLPASVTPEGLVQLLWAMGEGILGMLSRGELDGDQLEDLVDQACQVLRSMGARPPSATDGGDGWWG